MLECFVVSSLFVPHAVASALLSGAEKVAREHGCSAIRAELRRRPHWLDALLREHGYDNRACTLGKPVTATGAPAGNASPPTRPGSKTSHSPDRRPPPTRAGPLRPGARILAVAWAARSWHVLKAAPCAGTEARTGGDRSVRPDPYHRPRNRLAGLAVAALALVALASSGWAQSSGGGAPARANRHMIAAANPLAAEAGLEVLRAGGGAIDAAIAAQMVLNLVEPQSSGIGGGGFMLYYDAASGEVYAYDGRETAPAAATPGLFLDGRGQPLAFFDAVIGGRSVGVPGLLAMLERAHRLHGRLPWARLFDPAIALAEEGFAISPRLRGLVATAKGLDVFAATRSYFFTPEGAPKAVGARLANPAFAETLRSIATEGIAPFYRGAIAADIVAAVRGAVRNPGLLAAADLAAYAPREREPVCAPYRQWRVCGMGPPSSGGVTTLQILGILERFDLAALAPGSPEAVHLISEASRLAYADRARYLADADFVAVPVRGLVDRSYLAGRAGAIDPGRSMGKAEAGAPPTRGGSRGAPDNGTGGASTTHLSVVDDRGNAVSMTTSIESAFGSRLMVRGFLLNNQLTDFSFRPTVDGAPVANRVEPGKRPRSSMAPTLVFNRDGALAMAVGTPGGSRIIGYVVQALVAALDWGLDMQRAVSLPHHVNRNGPVEIEAETPLVAIEAALVARGHEVKRRRLVSGLHGVAVTPAGLEGGADPRREGVAIGD
ncbi:MAG: gamma-glutamyltransferase [Alphaproteobacteria bacterium]